jgi:hypothetical protein
VSIESDSTHLKPAPIVALQEFVVMGISFQKTIPIFRIFDVAKAREFYVDFLGFSLDREHRFEEVGPGSRDRA